MILERNVIFLFLGRGIDCWVVDCKEGCPEVMVVASEVDLLSFLE